jgi:Transposase IS66 family
VHKLDTFTDQQRAAQGRLRSLIWDYYASLKAYRLKPSARRAVALRARFDRIFLRRTGFVTLDRLLKRLHANKAELLMVLERPETPLHNNGSENDIRCYVTRRKVSAGTRSDGGRDCRHAFLGLAKTCDKLGVALWDYLGSRFKVAGHILGLSQSWPVDCFGLRLSASGFSERAGDDRVQRQPLRTGRNPLGCALVRGVSDQLPSARGDDGGARRGGRPRYLNRWVPKYVPLLEQEFRARKQPVGPSWRMDETL